MDILVIDSGPFLLDEINTRRLSTMALCRNVNMLPLSKLLFTEQACVSQKSIFNYTSSCKFVSIEPIIDVKTSNCAFSSELQDANVSGSSRDDFPFCQHDFTSTLHFAKSRKWVHCSRKSRGSPVSNQCSEYVKL